MTGVIVGSLSFGALGNRCRPLVLVGRPLVLVGIPLVLVGKLVVPAAHFG